MRTRINRLGFGLKALPPLSLVFFSVLIPPTPAQTIYPVQPNVPQGGRAVAFAVDAYGAIVASESGGLFTSKDEGATWSYVSSLPVFRMSDIAFVQHGVPGTQIIVATAYGDSHTANQGGIWRSTDGGAHWSKPATSNPPGTSGLCARANAYGIAAEPHSNNVYIGTDCGLAISQDNGATWNYSSPPRQPGSASDRVTAVAAQAKGFVDVCGDGGHYRFSAARGTWTPPSNALPGCQVGAVHAIAASPLEPSVLFATTGNDVLMESDDGGSTWTTLNPPATGYFSRTAWVHTHASTDGNADHFDLYFGNPTNVAHQACANRGGSGLRCTGPWTGANFDHWDTNDLAFSASADNCPKFLATDGGVHRTSDCGANWHLTGGGSAGYNALQVYEVTGQIHPDHVDEYFGTQDNNLWASPDGGTSWPNNKQSEGFHLQVTRSSPSHAGQIVTGVACSGNCSNFQTDAHLVSPRAWNDPGQPACCNPFIVDAGVFFQFGQPNPPAIQLFLTTNSGGAWNAVTQAGNTPFTISQSLAGFPRLSGPASDPVIYTAVGKPGLSSGGDTIVGLVRINGARAGMASLARADNGLNNIGTYCTGQGSFVCDPTWGVDPNNPQSLITADIGNAAMMVSHDGGGSWQADARLTDLVTWSGTLLFNVTQNSQPGRPGVAVQAHAIGFDPDNGNHILVGTEAAGIIESHDGGHSWNTIPASDFFVRGITNFFFENNQTVLIATYGRGLWKLTPQQLPPPVLCRDRFGRPIDCRTRFINPINGSLIYPHWVCPHPPEPPSCQFIAPSVGNFLDIAIDKAGKILSLSIGSKTLHGYAIDGKEMPVDLPVHVSKSYGTFAGCRECARVLKGGGTIQGIVVEKERLIALIAQYAKPQGEKKSFAAASKPSRTQARVEPPGPQPYIQLIGTVPITGEAVVLAGDSLSVYGSGFCPALRCSPVTLRLGDRVVNKELKVQENGAFRAQVKIMEPPGHYLVIAQQQGPKGELKDGKMLIVGIGERAEKTTSGAAK